MACLFVGWTFLVTPPNDQTSKSTTILEYTPIRFRSSHAIAFKEWKRNRERQQLGSPKLHTRKLLSGLTAWFALLARQASTQKVMIRRERSSLSIDSLTDSNSAGRVRILPSEFKPTGNPNIIVFPSAASRRTTPGR